MQSQRVRRNFSLIGPIPSGISHDFCKEQACLLRALREGTLDEKGFFSL